MNEAVMRKEEEEKKKKEDERRMRAGAPFGQPRQAEPAAKTPPSPFAPVQQAGKTESDGAPGTGAFQARKDIFRDELIHDTQSVEEKARSDYERAVAREKKAIVERAGRTVVVKREGREEGGKAKEGKKGNGSEKERKADDGENGRKK
ncbi:MAG: hypothetical protein Q7T16_00335 [Candidatus Burarchaeum sp.]|nr:hypothetical protein [Candidatus Burarchaeum sp.]MDO8339086.1 hypothetical protein [Candidatus Burarchaeum sp.]